MMKVGDINKISLTASVDGISESDTFDLDQISSINEDRLGEEMVRVPSTYAYYSILHAKSIAREMTLKFHLEVTEAELAAEKRSQYSSEKKATDGVIHSLVITDERYKKCYYDWLEAKESVIIIAKIEQTLSHKISMLMHLAADRRLEKSNYQKGGG